MTAIETNRATMTAYLDALVAPGNYAQYSTQDLNVQVVGSDQQAHGRGAAEGMIRYLHEQAFDAHPELKTLLLDGERAAVEAEFVGRQVAEFAGKVATGKIVRVPYSVVYELEGDRIQTLRIHGLMQGLLEPRVDIAPGSSPSPSSSSGRSRPWATTPSSISGEPGGGRPPTDVGQ